MTFQVSLKKEENKTDKGPTILSKRWILAYVGTFGCFVIFSMRVNLSVGIVCMVRDITNATTNTTTNSSSLSNDVCVADTSPGNSSDDQGEFDWDKTTQNLILSSFFFGYIATNFLGGWLAGVFGGKRVWGIGVFICALATVLLPVSARYSYKLVIALRVIMGLGQGVSFPSVHTMLGKWAPLKERSILSSFIYAGQNVGNIVTYAISGVLCAHGFDNGWGSIFYVTGGWCFIWVAAWFLLVSDTPEQHPTITEAERNYIVEGRGKMPPRDIVIPWKSMLKSRALWVCLTAHVCNNWLSYTLLAGLPTFMKEVLKFDIKENGLLSAVPYLVMIFTMLGSGYLADFVRGRYLSTTYTRRLFQSIAFLGSGACIVGVGFVDCTNREVAVVLLALAVGIEGFCFSGYNVNQVDFAPRYAGHLMGITNTIATIPGILAPTVIGALTQNKTQEEWRNVFYICGGMCLLGTICFGGFASGELEPWAVMPEEHVVEPPDLQEKKKNGLGHKDGGHLNRVFYNSDDSLHVRVTATDSVMTKL